MNSKLLLLLLLPSAFHNPVSDTEWWYYTGNLQSAEGHKYGYELTFFRQVNHESAESTSVWNPKQLYLAHLALSDIDGGKFEHTERLNRQGPGLAGAVWNGNWHVKFTSESGEQQLQAVASDFTLQLNLKPGKPFVTHGVDGISKKGPVQGEFSHYTSYTRLISEGTLERDGKTVRVEGTSWMDHEDFNDAQDADLRGWDWFAVQLDNNEELMLYRLRLKSGGISPYSSGTLIDVKGEPHHLNAGDIKLTPSGYWKSYPVNWTLEIPSYQIALMETTRLQNQELTSRNGLSPTYWEGAVEYKGTVSSQAVTGVGYLELTGYTAPLKLGH